MEKIFISNQIKMEILKICGLPANKPYNLPGETRLAALHNDNDDIFYRMLEEKLQEIAYTYHTGKKISAGDVSNNSSVSHCIKLVFASVL